MSALPIELENIRVFDVLVNTLSGELAVVMSVSGSLLDLRGRDGEVSRFKYGPHFTRASEDEAIAFRAAVRAARKAKEEASGKKRRKTTVNGLLRRLAKKR
jgi:hypothetical protein